MSSDSRDSESILPTEPQSCSDFELARNSQPAPLLSPSPPSTIVSAESQPPSHNSSMHCPQPPRVPAKIIRFFVIFPGGTQEEVLHHLKEVCAIQDISVCTRTPSSPNSTSCPEHEMDVFELSSSDFPKVHGLLFFQEIIINKREAFVLLDNRISRVQCLFLSKWKNKLDDLQDKFNIAFDHNRILKGIISFLSRDQRFLDESETHKILEQIRLDLSGVWAKGIQELIKPESWYYFAKFRIPHLSKLELCDFPRILQRVDSSGALQDDSPREILVHCDTVSKRKLRVVFFGRKAHEEKIRNRCRILSSLNKELISSLIQRPCWMDSRRSSSDDILRQLSQITGCLISDQPAGEKEIKITGLPQQVSKVQKVIQQMGDGVFFNTQTQMTTGDRMILCKLSKATRSILLRSDFHFLPILLGNHTAECSSWYVADKKSLILRGNNSESLHRVAHFFSIFDKCFGFLVVKYDTEAQDIFFHSKSIRSNLARNRLCSILKQRRAKEIVIVGLMSHITHLKAYICSFLSRITSLSITHDKQNEKSLLCLPRYLRERTHVTKTKANLQMVGLAEILQEILLTLERNGISVVESPKSRAIPSSLGLSKILFPVDVITGRHVISKPERSSPAEKDDQVSISFDDGFSCQAIVIHGPSVPKIQRTSAILEEEMAEDFSVQKASFELDFQILSHDLWRFFMQLDLSPSRCRLTIRAASPEIVNERKLQFIFALSHSLLQQNESEESTIEKLSLCIPWLLGFDTLSFHQYVDVSCCVDASFYPPESLLFFEISTNDSSTMDKLTENFSAAPRPVEDHHRTAKVQEDSNEK